MSGSVHTQRVQGRQLLPSMHLLREFVSPSSYRYQVRRSDDDFTLRNNHAVQLPAVDDACNSIPEVASNNGIDNEGLQAGCFRQKRRLSIEHSQVLHDFPRVRARNHLTATGRSVPLNSAHCDREYFAQRPRICGAPINNLEIDSSFAASSSRENATAGAQPLSPVPAVAEFRGIAK